MGSSGSGDFRGQHGGPSSSVGAGEAGINTSTSGNVAHTGSAVGIVSPGTGSAPEKKKNGKSSKSSSKSSKSAGNGSGNGKSGQNGASATAPPAQGGPVNPNMPQGSNFSEKAMLLSSDEEFQ